MCGLGLFVGTDGVTKGRDHGVTKGRRDDGGSKIANAKVIALRLELARRNYFSCACSGIFIGCRIVPLRLLTRDDRSRCES